MSEAGERYTELMAPAFVAALDNPEELRAEAHEDDFWSRFAAAQIAIREELKRVDWENSGLEEVHFGSEGTLTQAPLAPREFAIRLMSFAFDDALVPILHSENLVKASGIGIPMGKLLRDSRTNLLKVARLADDDKDSLLNVIKHRTTPALKDIADYFGEPKFEGSPVELTTLADGSPVLDWNPVIKDWVEANLYPDRGCPALRFPVNIDGKNMSLINYFWDRLTEVLYPEGSA